MSEGWSCSLNRLSSARSLEVCVSQRGVGWRGAGWPKLCSDAATPQLSFRIGARAQATLGLSTAATPLYQPSPDSTFLGQTLSC